MTERTNIPSSPACGHWETLLADALDGLLKPEDQTTFAAHMAVCPACTALFEESRRGREWLAFLSTEPEVPAGLLDRILAQTGPGQVEGYGLIPVSAASNVVPMRPRSIPAWQRPGFMGQIRRFAEPRLLMTAAMAFFSIALTLNLTNVRLSSIRLSDLRPSSVRSFLERRVTMASTPIIRYYDHLRFVYEVESRMRELRRNSEDSNQQQPRQAAPGESKQNPGRKDGGSRVDPPQQSVTPTFNDVNDLSETSLTFPALMKDSASQARSAHSGGSAMEVRERSTSWTA
ncbi:MAG: zf-HC2 domain-containing protein [Terracidiphilus sp.]|nr:zf-HC2 domain-containing protein [Terracidiphilus sp.]